MAAVGIAHSLSGAYLSLQHVGVHVDRFDAVTVTKVGEATCGNAMLMARSWIAQPPDPAGPSPIYEQPAAVSPGCIVCFNARTPRQHKKRWRRARSKRFTELFAYAALDASALTFGA